LDAFQPIKAVITASNKSMASRFLMMNLPREYHIIIYYTGKEKNKKGGTVLKFKGRPSNSLSGSKEICY
jgi:hypothetical protein